MRMYSLTNVVKINWKNRRSIECVCMWASNSVPKRWQSEVNGKRSKRHKINTHIKRRQNTTKTQRGYRSTMQIHFAWECKNKYEMKKVTLYFCQRFIEWMIILLYISTYVRSVEVYKVLCAFYANKNRLKFTVSGTVLLFFVQHLGISVKWKKCVDLCLCILQTTSTFILLHTSDRFAYVFCVFL